MTRPATTESKCSVLSSPMPKSWFRREERSGRSYGEAGLSAGRRCSEKALRLETETLWRLRL